MKAAIGHAREFGIMRTWRMIFVLTGILGLVFHARGGALPQGSIVDGQTIAEWTADWWKWAFSISAPQHPLYDTNGAWAGANQPSGAVFFVAGMQPPGGVVRRSFSVPEEKYLLVPLANVWSDNVYVSPPMIIGDMRKLNDGFVEDVIEVHASIDGGDITNLLSHREVSPVFEVTFTNANNIETVAAGAPIVGVNDPIVADGYWLMIEPLPVGTHVLRFGGTFGRQFQFSIDVTDTITVVSNRLPRVVRPDLRPKWPDFLSSSEATGDVGGRRK